MMTMCWKSKAVSLLSRGLRKIPSMMNNVGVLKIQRNGCQILEKNILITDIHNRPPVDKNSLILNKSTNLAA